MAVFIKTPSVAFGFAAGGLLGLINVYALFFIARKFTLTSYFIKTAIKFLVLVALFFVFIKLKANPWALLGGFTVPVFAFAVEGITRCKLPKKQ
jgi:hypothetical protein